MGSKAGVPPTSRKRKHVVQIAPCDERSIVCEPRVVTLDGESPRRTVAGNFERGFLVATENETYCRTFPVSHHSPTVRFRNASAFEFGNYVPPPVLVEAWSRCRRLMLRA